MNVASAQSSLGERIRIGERSALLGMTVNIVLAIGKILTGMLGNSYALVADGIESCADSFSSLVVLGGMRVSSRAANDRYPFGFGKAETLSAAFVAIMLIAAALGIFIAGVREIISPHHPPAPFTLFVLLVVIAIKWILGRQIAKRSVEIESRSLSGEAYHHLSDAFTSMAALIGISIALLGGPGWESADDWAALVAAMIIAFNGGVMLRESLFDLMDRAPDEHVIARIAEVAKGVPGVVDIEKLLVRRVGMGLHYEMHVHANPAMSLRDAHELGGIVKTAVQRAVPVVGGAVIHMEPAEK